jgi:hypothetical protein
MRLFLFSTCHTSPYWPSPMSSPYKNPESSPPASSRRCHNPSVRGPPFPQATATTAHPLWHVIPQSQDVVYVNCFHDQEFFELTELLGAQVMGVHQCPPTQEQVHLKPPLLLCRVHQPLPAHVQGRQPAATIATSILCCNNGEADMPFHGIVPWTCPDSQLLLANCKPIAYLGGNGSFLLQKNIQQSARMLFR